MGASAVLGSRAIRGMFFKRLEEMEVSSWAPQISHMFRSDQDSETYRFLGNVPALRAWRGARRKTEPKNYAITIINDKFEGSVPFAVDDLRRDKTDQIQARIGDLGARAAILPQKTLTTLIEGNGNAYDGASYFANHTSASTINNALTDSSVADAANPTAAEMESGILEIIETILGATDDTGEPMNEFAQEFLIMVPTKYWSATVAALRNDFTAASVSNTVRAVRDNGFTIDAVVNPRLTAPSSTGVFYGFRTDADIKPLIWQDEIEVELDQLAEGSDHEFWNDEHVYGAKRIGNGGFGAFEMAARMTFS